MTWIFSLIFAFAFDIYLPLIPELRSALETTQGNLQLFFSIYLIFAAIAQLIVTRIDSRRILFYGSIAFVCGTIACIAAQTLTLLLIARAFQAFGASLFLSRSYQGAIVAVSLLLAPTLGAILIYWLGPIGPSIFLLLLGILASVAAQTTPREAPQNPNINFLQTLKNPKFTLFALVQASGF
ncbi:MAG: MFS transporter, partial [Simkaniaceae bacterium]|nr:MFS transporter [Simkaniaceae bacterium]